MEILALMGYALILYFLWNSGIIPFTILACIFIFLWEKFNEIIITVITLSVLVLLLKYVFQIFGYMLFQGSKKDKSAEIPKTVKEQELENNLEKVREWSRLNKC